MELKVKVTMKPDCFTDDLGNIFQKYLAVVKPCNSADDLINSINRFPDLRSLFTFVSGYFKRELTLVQYCSLLFDLAGFAYRRSEIHLASRFYKKIISICEANNISGKENLPARSYLELSRCSMIVGRQTQTKKNIKRAKQLFARRNDRTGLAESENLLGLVYLEKGDLEKAFRQFEIAVNNVKWKKESHIKGNIYSNLGTVTALMKKSGEAMNYYSSAAQVFSTLSERGKLAQIEYNIGTLLMQSNRYEEASAYFKSSHINAEIENIAPVEAISHLGLAEALLKAGEYDLAEDSISRCLRIGFQINDRLTLAEAYKTFAKIHKALGIFSSAENLLFTGLRISRKGVPKSSIAEIYLELGLLYNELSRDEDASENLKKYHQLTEN